MERINEFKLKFKIIGELCSCPTCRFERNCSIDPVRYKIAVDEPTGAILKVCDQYKRSDIISQYLWEEIRSRTKLI